MSLPNLLNLVKGSRPETVASRCYLINYRHYRGSFVPRMPITRELSATLSPRWSLLKENRKLKISLLIAEAIVY